ncbi:ABC transporter permease [Ktedonosporobacter rubrisoli]|nr:ABC transporter permease [Ktedonosporobacter rubrisoli]
MLVTLGELFGFTLFLSGLALVFKQISALADMLQNLMLFLTGSLVPVSAFPTWLTLLTKILPTTEAVIVLRSVQLRGQSLVAAWLDGSLGALLLHALLYLGVGWLVYKLCERYARQQGSLGQY